MEEFLRIIPFASNNFCPIYYTTDLVTPYSTNNISNGLRNIPLVNTLSVDTTHITQDQLNNFVLHTEPLLKQRIDNSLKSGDDFWMERFSELKDFKNEYEHCNPSYLQHAQLYSWLHRQKFLYRKGKLPQDRFELLLELGVTFDYHWDEMYQNLKEFYEEQSVSSTQIPLDPKLSSWLWAQIYAWRSGKLPSDKIKKLEHVGLVANLETGYKPPKVHTKKKRKIEINGNSNMTTSMLDDDSINNNITTATITDGTNIISIQLPTVFQPTHQLQEHEHIHHIHHNNHITINNNNHITINTNTNLNMNNINNNQQQIGELNEEEDDGIVSNNNNNNLNNLNTNLNNNNNGREKGIEGTNEIMECAITQMKPKYNSERKSDQNWLQMYEKLKQFTTIQNTVIVPVKYDKKLNLWLRTQRKSWREGRLIDWKQKKLLKLGISPNFEHHNTNKKLLEEYQQQQQEEQQQQTYNSSIASLAEHVVVNNSVTNDANRNNSVIEASHLMHEMEQHLPSVTNEGTIQLHNANTISIYTHVLHSPHKDQNEIT